MYKVKIQKTNEEQKQVKIEYLVNAVSVTDAEKKVAEYENTDFKVLSISEVKGEFYGDEEIEPIFKATYNIVTIDEVTAKEKKQRCNVYFFANDIDCASEVFNNYVKGSVADVELSKLEKTKFEDYIS